MRWQLAVPASVAAAVKYLLTFGWLGFVVLVIASLFRGTPPAPRGELPGAWDRRPTPAATVSQ